MDEPNSERTEHVLLVASDVFSKHGFEEGDVLDELLDDNGFDCLGVRKVDSGMEAHDEEFFGHAVLTEVLSRRLVEHVREDAILVRRSRSKNPIRVDDTPENRKKLECVGFEVPVAEVLAVAKELAPEFSPNATLVGDGGTAPRIG